jgi:disulfide oxidoreductase YuzD
MNFADLTAEMTEELKKTYGDKVEVKYIDVDQVGLVNYPVMNQVLQMGYPYPVTLINGQPKFAGGIMTTEIKQLIEETISGKAN